MESEGDRLMNAYSFIWTSEFHCVISAMVDQFENLPFSHSSHVRVSTGSNHFVETLNPT